MYQNVLWALGGAAAAGIAAVLAKNGTLRKAAVTATAKAIAASEAVSAETQAIVDEANDILAEERRQAKIDAAVKAELDSLEADIRQKVTERIDKESASKKR